MGTNYLELTWDDMMDRSPAECLAWAEAWLAFAPEMYPDAEKFRDRLRRRLAEYREYQMGAYRFAYRTAARLLALGETPAMVRSLTMEDALEACPDLSYTDVRLRANWAGIEDAIAGREGRTGLDPAWDITPREWGEIPCRVSVS